MFLEFVLGGNDEKMHKNLPKCHFEHYLVKNCIFRSLQWSQKIKIFLYFFNSKNFYVYLLQLKKSFFTFLIENN